MKNHLRYLVLPLLVISFFQVTGTMAHDEHMMGHNASNHCDTPTSNITIITGENNQLAYDESEYSVPKDSCIMITLMNMSPDLDHDLQIDEVEGDDGIDFVHIHASASSISMMNIKTPHTDTEFDMYCTIEGHDAMQAVLIVGDGNTSFLPFNNFSVLLGLVFLATLPLIRGKYIQFQQL